MLILIGAMQGLPDNLIPRDDINIKIIHLLIGLIELIANFIKIADIRIGNTDFLNIIFANTNAKLGME